MSGVRFQDLAPGVRVSGLEGSKPVTIVAVEQLDQQSADITFRDTGGVTDSRVFQEEDLDGLELEPLFKQEPSFEADPNQFRLASEALRIKHAALYDPLIAVNSSNIDPLPHQIRAVYEHLLPKVGLRYLLADDPGAGKTIMAGLYLKEMMLRSNCERAIVVVPGGLVDQWQGELSEKFDLHFEVLDRQMITDAKEQNVFELHPHLLVRMDMVARDDDLMAQLEGVWWDVAIVDEAHRMSAQFSSWRGSVKETRRFQLGRILADRSHNFLLMTATPHAGKEEDFQLFMSLLDEDRFEGKYRRGVHRTDTSGLMRRMVKEDLLTFGGAPLFPERHAYTVTYDLSPAERELYEQVTSYVRNEMGRAQRLIEAGDGKRGNAVGFALTLLQRRLASSPDAIYRSLVRRKERLTDWLRGLQSGTPLSYWGAPQAGNRTTNCAPNDAITNPTTGTSPSDPWKLLDLSEQALDDYDDLDIAQQAALEGEINEVASMATAAQTVPELEAEIASLETLIEAADIVRKQDEDAKWVQLRQILDREVLSTTVSGDPRKIIIFTEHKDTLDYLHRKIGDMLGDPQAVVTIHGGLTHPQRREVREQFTNDPRTQVLIGTDAAGEGLNLQRAHLMVNYDLPWNPNRIEQRFGRIHRIGQREVCHLWNLVAADTREGDVFTRLLTKIEQMSKAYDGKLFHVLGEGDVFDGQSLRQLMIEAIRYGDSPEVREQQFKVVDKGIARGLDILTREGALAPEVSASAELRAVKESMEAARERRLQPGFVSAFFIPAFQRLGGRIAAREHGRYQITRVPYRIIERAKLDSPATPVTSAYERVTFDPRLVEQDGQVPASLLAPGNPLLSAVVDLTLEDLESTLQQGTVFVDRSDKQGKVPELSFIVEQEIRSPASKQVVSHSFDYVSLEQDEDRGEDQDKNEEKQPTSTTVSPYLAFDAPKPEEYEQIERALASPWFRSDHGPQVLTTVYSDSFVPRLTEVKARVEAGIEHTRALVHKRLMAEINYWDAEATRLRFQEAEGKTNKITSREAENKSKRLVKRLKQRMAELEESRKLVPDPPTLRGIAAVFPAHLLESKEDNSSQEREAKAKETEQVDRRAVDAVLAAERALGRMPEEMAHNQKGYDVRSTAPDGRRYYIEVKGRIDYDATLFSISAAQVLFAHNQEDRHRLAMVVVSSDGPEHDQLRYVGNAFDHFIPADTTDSLNERWAPYWERGQEPF